MPSFSERLHEENMPTVKSFCMRFLLGQSLVRLVEHFDYWQLVWASLLAFGAFCAAVHSGVQSFVDVSGPVCDSVERVVFVQSEYQWYA